MLWNEYRSIRFVKNNIDIPLPGCRSAERVEENAGGAEIQLTDDDVKAIRALVENADVSGERYTSEQLKATEGNCIPLSEWKGKTEAEA